MDYRALLKKYMEHVGECEGLTFVIFLNSGYSGVEFTDEEVSELEAIESEELPC